MSANLLGMTVGEVLANVLEPEPDRLFVVNPSGRVLEGVVRRTADRKDRDTEMHVLCQTGTIKTEMEDFIVASKTADLIEADALTIRTGPKNGRTGLFVTEDRVTALVEVGDEVGGLSTDDDAFVDSVFSGIESEWREAEPFQLRTPPLSRITTTLEQEINDEVRDDFEALLDSMETAKGNGVGLDEVTISLLVAARNNVLLYDISKWGEDVGIASKATFSRTKTKLEDKGLIDTEKVPIDVGRPRLRLKLEDDRLSDVDPAEMADIATTTLTN